MIRRAAEIVEFEDHNLAAGLGDVAVRGEAADAIVNSRRGRSVIGIHKVIHRERRVEGHAEEAALARRVDGYRQERRRQQRTVLDHAQASALLAHEQAPVRRKLHGRWTCEAAGHLRLGESGRQGRGGSGCANGEPDRNREPDDVR